jgi:hypothetical protein
MSFLNAKNSVHPGFSHLYMQHLSMLSFLWLFSNSGLVYACPHLSHGQVLFWWAVFLCSAYADPVKRHSLQISQIRLPCFFLMCFVRFFFVSIVMESDLELSQYLQLCVFNYSRVYSLTILI